MNGNGRAPRASDRTRTSSGSAAPNKSGLHPTRRTTSVSSTPPPSVEFPLRVHDSARLERLADEYERAAPVEVSGEALHAIATRRAWLRAELVANAAFVRWEKVARKGSKRDTAEREHLLVQSALRLREALAEVQEAVAATTNAGDSAAEPKAWSRLRGAYEWIIELVGGIGDAKNPGRPRDRKCRNETP